MTRTIASKVGLAQGTFTKDLRRLLFLCYRIVKVEVVSRVLICFNLEKGDMGKVSLSTSLGWFDLPQSFLNRL